MQFKITNETVEFEVSKNSKNADVLLGINIKESNDMTDAMIITITLTAEEYKQLQDLVKE